MVLYISHNQKVLPLSEAKIQHARHVQKSASHYIFYVTRLSIASIYTFPTKIFLNSSGGNLTLRKLA
jgi:hypothetical protein